MKILFVCTANICRSFMAEYIFKKMYSEKGLSNVSAMSASLLDMKGSPADPMAAEVLKEHGIDCSGHKSNLLTGNVIEEADMILVMTHQHKDKILENYSDAKDKIFLLKSFSKSCSRLYCNEFDDIKDPYKLSNYHYRVCFIEIYMSVEGLIKCIE